MNQVSEHPVKTDVRRIPCPSKAITSLFSRTTFSKNDWLLALSGAYCVVSVMMNLLCMKPLSFGTGFIWMDGGLLVSWMVFLISNVLTEAYGKRQAIVVAGIATVVAFAVSIIAAIEVHIPTLPEYSEQATHFSSIFSNGPRTIVSSALAFFIGNLINVEIIDRFRLRAVSRGNDNNARFAARAVFSTIVGQFVDNGLFQCLAFAPIGFSVYEMRWVDICTAVLTGTVIETVVESFFIGLITIPLTKRLRRMQECAY